MTPEERIALYEQSFTSDGGDDLVGQVQVSYIVDAITGRSVPIEPEPDELRDLAWSLESLGIEARRSGASEASVIGLFDKAYRLRTSALSAGQVPVIADIWLLVTSGIASQRQPELRETLGELDWMETFGPPPESWDGRVLWESSRALFHLARKGGGWSDIDLALSSLRNLVDLQQQFEPDALAVEAEEKRSTSTFLLGLYHLAEGLTTLGDYLRTGAPESVLTAVERNTEHARYLLGKSKNADVARIGAASTLIFPQLVRSCIWHNTSRLSEAAREFARRLAGQDRDNPVLELWWAQREALAQNLLDPYKVAIGVQMPTSAGKTLLAEFSIVQTLALNPRSTIAYVVPTRALVNQVTRRLREDLEGAGIEDREMIVESAVPVFELDPTENAMLAFRPDILVTTPEKLDLLVRSQHPAVHDIALVVVDEAHLISEPTRGPRLELLLATLKRERGASCRYLLLTPFLPNASELARWLGDADYAAISLDWRPSLQLRAIAHWKRQSKKYRDVLTLVPSMTQPETWSATEIDLGESRVQPKSRSRPGISSSTAIALSSNGSAALVLTQGQGTAETRATDIAAILREEGADTPDDPVLRDVISYVASELGESYPLVSTLRSGVAFHHAGLPPEVRILIEGLLDRGLIRIVTGTTTLAQGVNFPLGAVVIETLTMPQGFGKKRRPLQFSEFWNIAGRAGRALKDKVGVVVWPSDKSAKDAEFIDFLQGEAVEIVSALAEILSSMNDASTEYGLELVRRSPSLSHFLQFLAHALRVGGFAQASAEIEDILRSSLIFHRLRIDDRDAAERLVRWSRGFLEANRDRQFLDVADTTGLSLPSVGLLSLTASQEMRDPEFWLPDNLFGSDLTALTSTVELLADVPEFSLGLDDQPGGLNAYRVAGILRDWVNGATLPDLVRNWNPVSDESRALRDIGRYLFRDLTGQMPWGLGALQLISMTGNSEGSAATEARRVPAMAYYGVRSRGGIAMRMVGVPRAAAESLGSDAPEFGSFAEARRWISELPNSRWESAGELKGVSGSVLRHVWELTALSTRSSDSASRPER